MFAARFHACAHFTHVTPHHTTPHLRIRTAELQARLVSVEEQLQRKTLRLRRLLGVYRNLRCMCEDNDLPVPRSDRFEEAELDEPAEVRPCVCVCLCICGRVNFA